MAGKLAVGMVAPPIHHALPPHQPNVGEGKYQFDIANNGIDREVGFVLVPKGKYDAADHIKTAYVKEPVADGNSSQTGIVNLEAGEYEYFCPLNNTPAVTTG